MPLLFLLAISIFFSSGHAVFATAPATQTIDTTELNQFWDDVSTEYDGFLPESQKGSLSDYLSGAKKFSPTTWVTGLAKFAFQEVLANGKLLGMLILLTVFSVLLQNLHSAFEQSSVSKVANVIVMMVLLTIAISSLHTAMGYVTETIGRMNDFLTAMIPILLALIGAGGGALSASFFHPVLLFLINFSGTLVTVIILPFLFCSTVLSIVSEMNEQFKMTQLASILKSASVWLLGAFMTIFLGVLSLQGVTSAVADGIGLRTAKFVSSNFVPVVGKMLTDATDTVVNASVLLKNSVGLAGLVILFLVIIFPAIKIFVMAFLYRGAAAILQPIGGGAIIKVLDVIGKNLLYVFGAFVVVGLMFFLSITIVITAGNITMMVR